MKEPTMRIVGIDPSLTGTGIAFPDGTTRILTPSKFTGLERLVDLRDRLQQIIRDARPHVVIIEDYAYGMPHSSVRLGEWGGVMRVMLWELGIDLVCVNPTHLKGFQLVKVKGAAKGEKPAPKKDQALSAMSAVSGITFPDSDQMDAWSLTALAYAYIGESWLKRTAEQLAVMACIHWPESMRAARAAAGLPAIAPPAPKPKKVRKAK